MGFENSQTFLQQLEQNNNRDWFQANKAQYEQNVREPALNFIEQMAPVLADIAPAFTAVAKKVGGSLMRVHRDVRFSKNKLPYKTNVGMQFRHKFGKDVHAPGYYVHLENQQCFLGMGIWRPASPALAMIRTCIDENQRSWNSSKSFLQPEQGWQLDGETLKRPPRGYPSDHPLLIDLKRKDFIAIRAISWQDVTSPHFSDFCRHEFSQGERFMAYLCHALDVPF